MSWKHLSSSGIWPNFDQTFWTQFWQALIFLDQKLFGPKFCLTLTFVDLQTFFYPKFFWTQNFVDLRFCGPKIVFHSNFFGPKFFWAQIFLQYLLTYLFLILNSVYPQLFHQYFFWTQFFPTQCCFWGATHISYHKWEAKFQTNEQLNFKLYLTKLGFAV